GQQLFLGLPTEELPLDGDGTRLSQVFANLLNNAAKYTEPGGCIWLTAVRRDGEVQVTVRDTGVGIPSAALPYVFEMFMQVDRSLERSQGGLGIGLTLVKLLVELHGGVIEASSEGVGKGSAFTVRLPLAAAAAATAEHPAPRIVPLERPRRIVVADDNRD